MPISHEMHSRSLVDRYPVLTVINLYCTKLKKKLKVDEVPMDVSVYFKKIMSALEQFKIHILFVHPAVHSNKPKNFIFSNALNLLFQLFFLIFIFIV